MNNGGGFTWKTCGGVLSYPQSMVVSPSSMAKNGPPERGRAFQRRFLRASRVIGISERIEDAERLEAIKTARTLAIAGLPKQRHPKQSFSRTLRVGRDLWMKVIYTAPEGNELPFGADRFVLAGIQHLALQQDSPVVFFDRVGTLLKYFGLAESGTTISLLRKRFTRLAELSVRLRFGRNQQECDELVYGEQLFIIKRYSLPTRQHLKSEFSGQLTIPGSHPFGVELGDSFWKHLCESKNHLLIPLELLKLFLDRPTGWDYLCFLTARCGSAERSSKIPHEALIALFRDTERQDDRNIIRGLQRYHREIMTATGGRLNADLVEDGHFPTAGAGRPKKRWALIVRPSKSLFSSSDKLLTI